MHKICNDAKEKLNDCVVFSDSAEDESPTFTINNNFINSTSNATTATTTSRRSRVIPLTTLTTSAYDTVQRPFKPDKQRGCWSTSIDFYFASTSHAFGTVVFSEISVFALLLGGAFILPVYLLALLLYAIPIFLLQTFLGQFSTSGTISAFRVAPLFKGIGYSIIILNGISLMYYAVVAAVPLVYALYSLQTVIPWMHCDNYWNTENCKITLNAADEDNEISDDTTAVVEFFRHIFKNSNTTHSLSISWPVLCAILITWFLVLIILLRNINFIGKFFRCSCILMLTVFFAIFVHLLFYKEISWSEFWNFFHFKDLISHASLMAGLRAAVFMSTWLLGPGWGNILTLSSYNKFRCDSEKLTYRIGITYGFFTLMGLVCGKIALDHFEDGIGFLHFEIEEDHDAQFLFLCYAYLFGSYTSLPNFWSFLFFMMLFVAELSAVIIQMLTILTAVFDEFEQLRRMKKRITISLVIFFILTSTYFCTKQGLGHLHLLPNLNLLTHVIISAILLLVTLWIYGRERFQCDLQFMLGKTITNFKIFLMRFITPIFVVYNILQIIFFLDRDSASMELVLLTQFSVFIVAIIYFIYKLSQTNGNLRQRMKQCFQPHDWHPVDADNRRYYEEIMGVSEMLVIDQTTEQQQNNA